MIYNLIYLTAWLTLSLEWHLLSSLITLIWLFIHTLIKSSGDWNTWFIYLIDILFTEAYFLPVTSSHQLLLYIKISLYDLQLRKTRICDFPRSKSKKLPFLFDLKTWKYIAAWSHLSRMYFLTQMRSSKDPLYVKSIKPFCHSLVYSLCIKDMVKALIQFIFKSINQCKSRRCNVHSMWRVEVSE